MMHRILRKGKGVTAEELSTKLLADVKLVATRLAHLGPDAICDSPADLEWLADKAFDLGIECIAASEPGAATDTASGGATEDERLGAVDDDALRRSTEFVSASCELRERLPGSDEHLQRLMQGQMVLCRGCVLLAKRRLPAEQRTLLLAKAAKAVEVAFRAYGRTARSRGQLGETRGRHLTVCAASCAPGHTWAPRASAQHSKGLCRSSASQRAAPAYQCEAASRPHSLGLGRPKGVLNHPALNRQARGDAAADRGPDVAAAAVRGGGAPRRPKHARVAATRGRDRGDHGETCRLDGRHLPRAAHTRAAPPAWPFMRHSVPYALPWGFVQVPESGLWAASVQASCGLSGSHSLIYAARWTSPCVQATRHKLELGRLAFDLALKRRQAEVPKDYDQIAWLLRQLISTCTHHTRHDAKRYFEAARDELERFSPANCPMGEDELHWSATHASSRP